MNKQNDSLLTAIAKHTSYLYRLNSGEVNKSIKTLNSVSNSSLSVLRDLFDDLSELEKGLLISGSYTTTRLKKIKDALNEWQSEVNTQLYEQFDTAANILATNEIDYTSKIATAGEIGATTVALTGSQVVKEAIKNPTSGGFLVRELFNSLGVNLRNNVERTFREGLQNGLTNQQIWREIKGRADFPNDPSVLRTARIEVDKTVRTARMHVANQSYIDTFKAIGFEYVKIVATLDGRTCKVCAARDGDVHKISELRNAPPWHPNSRTVIVGCDKDGNITGRRPFVKSDQPVSKIPKDMRDGVVGQVNSNTTFKDLIANDDNFAREWLGPTKYKLYKEGGMSIDKFVDPLNKPYTIAELRSLDEKIFKDLGL